MMKMLEYKFNLEGTVEDQKKAKEALDKGEPWVQEFEMPVGSIPRRINARIFQVEKAGIDPRTKELGKFVIGEEQVWLWAEGDPDGLKLKYKFYIIPTGFKVPEGKPYVGTFLLSMGQIVFHVYGPDAVPNLLA